MGHMSNWSKEDEEFFLDAQWTSEQAQRMKASRAIRIKKFTVSINVIPDPGGRYIRCDLVENGLNVVGTFSAIGSYRGQNDRMVVLERIA